MADWDDDNFEPTNFVKKASDKWEGEDEDDEDIKDNWFDEDEEENKKEETKTDSIGEESKTVQVKKKKSLKEKILEKEKQKEEEKKKIAEMNLTGKKVKEAELTPQEILEEKLKRQKLVEEADLELALETFGTAKEDGLEKKTIDGCHPTNREEFNEFSSLIVTKLSQYETNPDYIPFLDGLFRDLCASLDAEEIKKLGSTLNVLSSEKLKQQKGPKAKKKGKKTGVTIKSGKVKDEFDMGDSYGDGYQDDFDGFL